MLLIRGARGRPGPGTGKATEILSSGLASINVVGALGLVWFAARLLFYDGLMIVELAICAGLIAVLAMVTGGAFALKRRGKTNAAIAVLAVVALPTIAAFGFLLYLDSNPIDMR